MQICWKNFEGALLNFKFLEEIKRLSENETDCHNSNLIVGTSRNWAGGYNLFKAEYPTLTLIVVYYLCLEFGKYSKR